MIEAIGRLTRAASLTPLLRYTNRFEVAATRRFGRSLFSALTGIEVLVIDTIGARSGKTRPAIVAWVPSPDGTGSTGAMLIGGGAGGRPQTPDWVVNLRAHGRVQVSVNRRTFEVVAKELTGDERDRALTSITDAWPPSGDYERQSGRPLPVFLLSPTG